MTTSGNFFHEDKRKGFTLLELLVVMGVIVLLLALVVPAVQSIGRAYGLTNAANLISDQISLARQTAATDNAPVELRFYEIDEFPDNAQGEEPILIRGMQLFILRKDGPVPLDRMLEFQQGIGISQAPEFSTWISNAPTAGVSDVAGRKDLPYKAFLIYPSGKTNLLPTGLWYLTIVERNSPKQPNGLPANFITIQLDPITGRIRQFQPG